MTLARLAAHPAAAPSRRSTPSLPRASPSSSPPPPPPAGPDVALIDPVFLTKLALVSTSGAALIKYGTPFLDAPFHPTAALAAGMVTLPTLAYGALLAVEAGRTVKGKD